MSKQPEFDVVVVGAGPAGLAAALALAKSGLETAVIAAPHNPAATGTDTRTAALFTNSLTLLRNLGAWRVKGAGCEAASAPLAAIRLIDDTGNLLRAPEVLFEAREIGLDAFGYNVPQQALVAALRSAALDTARLTIIESAGVSGIAAGTDEARLVLAEDRAIVARLVVGADGRRSICRRSADIGATTRDYDQAAIACTFTHSAPHDGVSTEFHRRAGPMTTVPLPGRASSLIWVEHPDVARRLAAADEGAFTRTLMDNLQGLLGTVSNISQRAVFPLSTMQAESMGRNRIALVGEAAHVAPPIGAQGLNLSLRDIATLAELAGEAKAAGEDLGGERLLEKYNAARRADVRSRGLAVDLLNHSLTSQLIPVQLLRGAGIHALKAISPLRRSVMAAGLAPGGEPPPLMRADPATAATPPFASRSPTL
jgi:2-octaprenyl-6-methoxyphenol hydroxylase